MGTRKLVHSAGALAAVGAIAAVMAGAASTPAAAAIRCEGNFQINSYGRIATPYCQDNYLAQVAREYGMRVSNRAIRHNPSIKERACRLVGHDNRVRDTCAQYMPGSRRRWY